MSLILARGTRFITLSQVKTFHLWTASHKTESVDAAHARFAHGFTKDVSRRFENAGIHHKSKGSNKSKMTEYDDGDEASESYEEDEEDEEEEDEGQFDVYLQREEHLENLLKHHQQTLLVDSIQQELDPNTESMMMLLDPSIRYTKEKANYFGRWCGESVKLPLRETGSDKNSCHSLDDYVNAIAQNLVSLPNEPVTNSLPLGDIGSAIVQSYTQLQLDGSFIIHSMVIDIFYMSLFGVCMLWGVDLCKTGENRITKTERVWTYVGLDQQNLSANYRPFSLRISYCPNGVYNRGVSKTQLIFSRICHPVGKLRDDMGRWFLGVLESCDELDYRLFVMTAFDWVPSFAPLPLLIKSYQNMLLVHPSMALVMPSICKWPHLYRLLALHPIHSLKVPVKSRVALQLSLLRSLDCTVDMVYAYWAHSPATEGTDPIELLPIFLNLNWNWSLTTLTTPPRDHETGVVLAHLKKKVPFDLSECHFEPETSGLKVLADLALAHVAVLATCMMQDYLSLPYVLHAIRNPQILEWNLDEKDRALFYILQVASYLHSETMLLQFACCLFGANFPLSKVVFLQRAVEMKRWFIRPQRIVNSLDYGFSSLNRNVQEVRFRPGPRNQIISGRVVRSAQVVPQIENKRLKTF